MEIQPRIELDPNGMGQSPFNDFHLSSDPLTLREMERLAIDMSTALKADFEQGHQSNNPRTQRSTHRQRVGGGYFSVQVQSTVLPGRKIPIFYITSTAVNALKYEASHGNMTRILAKFADRF